MPKIPAICKTCNTIFPTILNLKPNVSVTLSGCVYTCPKCGKPAHILDGVYKGLDNAVQILLQHPAPELLNRLIGVLREASNIEAHHQKKKADRTYNSKAPEGLQALGSLPLRLSRDQPWLDELVEKIKDATPELQSISDCLPTNRTELYACLRILTTITIAIAAIATQTSACRSESSEKIQPTIEVRQEYIDNSINLIYRNEAPE